MGIPQAVALLALALLGMICGPAAVKAQSLLPILSPPAGCGYILQVQQGDTCQGLADWAGISYTKFVSLNPLLLCGILNPVPGVLVCAGDKLSFCSNFYRTVAGDTCASLAPLGTVVGLAAGVSCATPLPVDTEVCLAPTANQCDVASLCGVPLSANMKAMLGQLPDWCSVLKECKAPLSATTTSGLPSITAVFTDITPGMTSVVGNEGHPEMADYVKQRTAGPASLQMAFVPSAAGDGEGASDFVITSGASGRKLLATAARAGQPRTPPRIYY